MLEVLQTLETREGRFAPPWGQTPRLGCKWMANDGPGKPGTFALPRLRHKPLQAKDCCSADHTPLEKLPPHTTTTTTTYLHYSIAELPASTLQGRRIRKRHTPSGT